LSPLSNAASRSAAFDNYAESAARDYEADEAAALAAASG
jgi:hypothetical protein